MLKCQNFINVFIFAKIPTTKRRQREERGEIFFKNVMKISFSKITFYCLLGLILEFSLEVSTEGIQGLAELSYVYRVV